MNIGIVTITEGYNYGNKLQNYALKTFLENEFQEEVKTLNNGALMAGRDKFTKFKLLCKGVIHPCRTIRRKCRDKRFEEFNKKYLNFTDDKIVEKNVEKFSEFDAFVCGSDQIWNPYYFNSLMINTAAFTNAKRIAYAASIGIEEIPDNRLKEYEHRVGTMDAIGVREDKAKELLEKIIPGIEVSVQADPTLLLEKRQWIKFEKKPRKKITDKYLLTYFILKPSNEMKKYVEKVAKHYELEIINLNDADNDWYSLDPNEFVYMIHNANAVITDSFHASVFSIVMNTPFAVFDRNSLRDLNKQNSRLLTLLSYFQLQDRYNFFDIDSFMNVDFSDVSNILVGLKEQAITFFNENLKSTSVELVKKKSECCGCGICAINCPVDAIKMKLDFEGFRYPVINQNKCIKCGKCIKSCILRNPEDKQMDLKIVNGVESKNEEERRNSSSGGCFGVIARNFIKNNGIVIAPKFDNHFILKHEIIKSEDEVKMYLGSKYVQSQAENLFREIENMLMVGKKILFTGTPCQVYALKKWLRKDYDDLYLQDIVCHGCSSLFSFHKYIDYLERKYVSKVYKFDFRNKDDGWSKYNIAVHFENGNILKEFHAENDYYKAFLKNFNLRPSCYQCPFRKMNRVSDITLGDFWGLKRMHDNKGTTLTIIHTEKGKRLFDYLKKENAKIFEMDFEEGIAKNQAYFNDENRPKKREEYMRDDILNFSYIEKKYYENTIVKKVKRRIKKFISGSR